MSTKELNEVRGIRKGDRVVRIVAYRFNEEKYPMGYTFVVQKIIEAENDIDGTFNYYLYDADGVEHVANSCRPYKLGTALFLERIFEAEDALKVAQYHSME